MTQAKAPVRPAATHLHTRPAFAAPILPRRPLPVACKSSGPQSPLAAWSAHPGSPGPAAMISRGLVERQVAAVSVITPKPALALSSYATTTAAAIDASLPSTFARLLVGAALALSTLYALLSSTLTSSAPAPSAFPPSTLTPSASPMDADAAVATASAAIVSAAQPTFTSMSVLSNREQFDAFVLASNRAGYLAVVLFHAPWCAASRRMETELHQQAALVSGRRVVFARVDCSMQPSTPTAAPSSRAAASPLTAAAASFPSGSSLAASQSVDGTVAAAARGPGAAAGMERCGLAKLHRIHRTPTVRMYYGNTCVDEVTGCRPVDFRQAVSDLSFKYGL